MLFQILCQYTDGESPRQSSHRVSGDNEKDAVDVANKYKIGKSFGRPAKRTVLRKLDIDKKNSTATIWTEDKKKNKIINVNESRRMIVPKKSEAKNDIDNSLFDSEEKEK